MADPQELAEAISTGLFLARKSTKPSLVLAQKSTQGVG